MWWLNRSVGDVVPELPAPRRVAQLAQRVCLDLADPLTGQPELMADLLERSRSSVVEPEPEADDPLLAAFEAVEDLGHLLAKHRVRDGLERRDRVRILDQAAELGIALVADRCLERDGIAPVAPDLLDLLGRDRGLRVLRQDVSDLRVRRLTPELDRELARGPRDAVHRLDHVDRDADRPRLV